MPLDPKQISRRREKLKLDAREAAALAGWRRGAGAFKKWMQLEVSPGILSLADAEDVARVLNRALTLDATVLRRTSSSLFRSLGSWLAAAPRRCTTRNTPLPSR